MAVMPRVVRIGMAGALLMLAAGCSSGEPSIPKNATLMRVTERDFKISAPTHVSSGNLVLSVQNVGPNSHELLVVHADGPLTLRHDGITVDEKALGPDIAGLLEPGQPGAVRTLRLHLAPGRYLFICNMSGHYLGGMHHELVVG